MKTKKLLFILLLAIFILLAPRIYILAMAANDYFNTDEECLENPDIISPGTWSKTPIILYEIKPYLVITDRGYLFPGGEYETYTEGDWLGMAVLIWAGKDGAYFINTYDLNDPIEGYSRPQCRYFAPVGIYQ